MCVFLRKGFLTWICFSSELKIINQSFVLSLSDNDIWKALEENKNRANMKRMYYSRFMSSSLFRVPDIAENPIFVGTEKFKYLQYMCF
jgi:hypothetical protein